MILFDFDSTHYKIFIYLPCIITQRRTTAPLNITHVLSSRDRQTPRLYQGSEDSCGGDYNFNVVSMLQPSLTIHYCNQSVLTIVPDLNIFVWSIMIFDIISKSALDELVITKPVITDVVITHRVITTGVR